MHVSSAANGWWIARLMSRKHSADRRDRSGINSMMLCGQHIFSRASIVAISAGSAESLFFDRSAGGLAAQRPWAERTDADKTGKTQLVRRQVRHHPQCKFGEIELAAATGAVMHVASQQAPRQAKHGETADII